MSGYILLGYILFECNLTGLVSCSDVLGLSGYVLPPE